jgi:hypothetical protein
MSFIVKVFKKDARCTAGERYMCQYPFHNCKDVAAVERELAELSNALYPRDKYRFEIMPATMKVKSYMTGEEVEIPIDTPWSCNPASESYWSM